jgi:hypothetical protein
MNLFRVTSKNKKLIGEFKMAKNGSNVDKFDIDAFIEEELQEMERGHPRDRKLSEELTGLYNKANVTMEDVFTDLKINDDTLAEILYASPDVPKDLTKSLKNYLQKKIDSKNN